MFIILVPAQTSRQFTVTLTAVDHPGNLRSIQFGNNPSATPCLDTALGEYELPPPPPPPMLVLMFKNISNACPGYVYYNKDLRPWRLNIVDTFYVSMTPGNDSASNVEFPIALSWTDIGSYYDGSVRMLVKYIYYGETDQVITDTIDMKSINSISINQKFSGSIKIYASHAHYPPVPVNTTAGLVVIFISLVSVAIWGLRKRLGVN